MFSQCFFHGAVLFDFECVFQVSFNMEFDVKIAFIAEIFLFTLALNLVFGYFRGKTKRFSLMWFLCVHLPIPFVFIARTLSHLEMTYIPVFALAAVIGQVWGGKLEY